LYLGSVYQAGRTTSWVSIDTFRFNWYTRSSQFKKRCWPLLLAHKQKAMRINYPYP